MNNHTEHLVIKDLYTGLFYCSKSKNWKLPQNYSDILELTVDEKQLDNLEIIGNVGEAVLTTIAVDVKIVF